MVAKRDPWVSETLAKRDPPPSCGGGLARRVTVFEPPVFSQHFSLSRGHPSHSRPGTPGNVVEEGIGQLLLVAWIGLRSRFTTFLDSLEARGPRPNVVGIWLEAPALMWWGIGSRRFWLEVFS